MCFYNDDYDWYAEVEKVETVLLEKPEKCQECGQQIAAGEICERVEQHEHEECHECYGEDSECEHDYGEEYIGYTCPTCLKILKAIAKHEEESGCPEHSRRPRYGGLYDEAFSNWNDESLVYAQKCVEMFPELNEHYFISQVLERSRCPVEWLPDED